MFSIKTMCDRVIYLSKGRIEFDGAVEAGIALYEKDCRLTALSWTQTKPEEWPIFITGCELLDENRKSKSMFNFGERLTLRLAYKTRRPVEHPNFIVAFIRSDGTPCCNYSTETDGIDLGAVSGTGFIELQTPPLKLVSEMYTVSVLVREKEFQQILCGQIATTFHVRHPLFNTHFGVFHEPATWRVEQEHCSEQAEKVLSHR
jgi:lipopolysaccharide transport system ATP-binding protein